MAKDKPKKKYSENVGRAVLQQYNTAIDNITSKRDPKKVLEEISRVASIGLENQDVNEDYLGRLMLDDDLQKLVQAVDIYSKDRNLGLEKLAEASQPVYGKLVVRYAAAYNDQEGVKPEIDDATKNRAAISNTLSKWTKPEEEQKKKSFMLRAA
ncbi:MAG: hypothetical protein AABW46_01530 [Nanoarchaeota archaeon]